MKKVISRVLVLLAWTTSLSAQITREQADAIVLDYLKNEKTQFVLYVNNQTPAGEGITLTTSKEETFKAKYACWVYCMDRISLNTTMGIPTTHYCYLFVKADTGNLLEVITSNDLGPKDLAASWQEVKTTTGITETENNANRLYPNPVDDLLMLPCNGENTCVEIYDLKGTRLFSDSLSGENPCQLNVSFLSAGIYIVNVAGKSFRIIKK